MAPIGWRSQGRGTKVTRLPKHPYDTYFVEEDGVWVIKGSFDAGELINGKEIPLAEWAEENGIELNSTKLFGGWVVIFQARVDERTAFEFKMRFM